MFKEVFGFIEQHHEYSDGTGYPFGLTQEQLAEQLGISLKYISRIENGNNGIKTQTLIKYMNILKITPNTLYKEFITDSQTKKNIELTEKICSLSEEKKVFITSVIDLLNDM